MTPYPIYKLGEIVDFYSGYGFPKNLQGKKTGKYPFYKVGDISKNVQNGFSHLLLCDNFIDDNDLSALKGVLLPESTLVFAKIGEALKLNRRALTKGLCLVDNNVVGIKAKTDKCLDLYLFYYFKTIKLEKYSRATTVPSVRKSDIELIPIPLPPLPTQRLIVSRIESLFAELDKAVQHLRTAQQQIKTYRQAVLNHWLNNDEGKWEMVPIKEIINVISNGSTPKADKMFSKGEIQFLKVYNLNFDGSINLSKEPVFIDRETHETLLKRSQTKQGDVLINIVGPPLGKVSIVPEGEKEYNINQAIVMFRPNEFVTSKFLAYYLMSPQVIAWLTSTSKATAGQYNVKVSTCREIMFPKISLSEQQRIVKEIESRLSQATASETYIENALQQAEALRQSILKKAFEGELV